MTFGLSAGALAAVAMAGGAVAGGVISANGAKDAANAQVGAANNATQSQRDMFDKTVQLEQPYNNAGVGATQKLAHLLGIDPGYMQGGGAGGSAGETADQIRQRLQSQYTKLQTIQTPVQNQGEWGGTTLQEVQVPTVDQAGLDAAVQAEMQRQQTGFNPTPRSTMAAPVGGAGDQSFGSLLKPFDMNDFQMDPGTQFRIKYGQQALQNSQAAQNGVMSGSALKDLIGFNQDYAGLGYQSAFDRYNANRSFTLGSLNDLANRGQAAAGNTVNSAGQFSSGIANTITGAGNAAAAGTVGSANALSAGISGAGNAYMLRNMLGGGGNSSSDVNAANNSSDPIGAMNSLRGWTTAS